MLWRVLWSQRRESVRSGRLKKERRFLEDLWKCGARVEMRRRRVGLARPRLKGRPSGVNPLAPRPTNAVQTAPPQARVNNLMKGVKRATTGVARDAVKKPMAIDLTSDEPMEVASDAPASVASRRLALDAVRKKRKGFKRPRPKVDGQSKLPFARASTAALESSAAPAHDMRQERLTNEQWDAVSAPLGVLAVVAGPGSGKTRVLVHRILWLIHGGPTPGQKPEHVHPEFVAGALTPCPAQGILALTFTNKSAGDMRKRIFEALTACIDSPHANPPLPLVCTFHSFAFRVLKTHPEAAGLPWSSV